MEDWWYRFEWQHRGSVHVHGIGKKRNAPDYIELVNKLQRHTRCSPSYCLRVNQAGEQSCRFGYPKENTEHTNVRDDGHGNPELVTARNDPLINPHNRLQLQGWRANVDLKPILSIHAALQYISKYASKAEPQSMAYSEILSHILNKSNPNDPFHTSVQKLLLRSVAERDFSAQETCHLLVGIPLYHSSRSFVSLNLNKEAPRWLRGTGNNESNVLNETEDTGRTTRSPLELYRDRPTELENFSLFKLYLTHKFIKNKWKECSQENIVRIFPRPSGLINGAQWEEFCRVKVLLHVQYRDLEKLTESNTIAWSTLYSRHQEEINSDPNDLLGQPVNNEEERINDENEEEQIEDDEQEEFRFDWMFLAEMGPDAVIDSSSELGTRDIDRNYDWINNIRQRYSDSDFANADTFVKQAS